MIKYFKVFEFFAHHNLISLRVPATEVMTFLEDPSLVSNYVLSLSE